MLWHIGHPTKSLAGKTKHAIVSFRIIRFGGVSIAWFVSLPGFARSSTTGSQHMAGGCGDMGHGWGG